TDAPERPPTLSPHATQRALAPHPRSAPVTEWLWAVGLGTAGGVLPWAAVRVPLLAWIALAPLGVALLTLPPPFAALAAAFTGSIASVEPVSSRTLRVLVLPAAAVSGLGWGAAFGLA